MVQRLELCASTARDLSSIPGWGTKILQVMQLGQKKKKKKNKIKYSKEERGEYWER